MGVFLVVLGGFWHCDDDGGKSDVGDAGSGGGSDLMVLVVVVDGCDGDGVGW